MSRPNKNKENIQLIPVVKAAEEFGVSRQTICNWHEEGLLQGTVIKGNHFVTRESLDKLKDIYPEAGTDAAVVLKYKNQVEEEREQLQNLAKTLHKERIYRGYAPRYVNNFIENAIGLIKTVDEGCTDELLESQFIRCWLFGYNIEETCKENGVTYFRYLSSVKRYIKALRRMEQYTELLKKYREMEEELRETKEKLKVLQADMDEYRSKYDQVNNEQTWKEKFPCLWKDISELDFSVRTMNILKSYDFKNMAEIIKYERYELLKLRNFGKKCLVEILDFLEPYGLELGMDLESETVN